MIFPKNTISLLKMGQIKVKQGTLKSDFGSHGFGKNCICHVISDAIRVPKMYILSMLEISRVITIPITLKELNRPYLK